MVINSKYEPCDEYFLIRLFFGRAPEATASRRLLQSPFMVSILKTWQGS